VETKIRKDQEKKFLPTSKNVTFGFPKHSTGIDPSNPLFSGNEKKYLCQIKCVLIELNYRSCISIQYVYLNLVHAMFLNYRSLKGCFLQFHYCLNERKGKSRNFNEHIDDNKFFQKCIKKHLLRRRLDKYIIFSGSLGIVPIRMFLPMLLIQRI